MPDERVCYAVSSEFSHRRHATLQAAEADSAWVRLGELSAREKVDDEDPDSVICSDVCPKFFVSSDSSPGWHSVCRRFGRVAIRVCQHRQTTNIRRR